EIREAEKNLEPKMQHQEGQDVLGAHAFESDGGCVGVFELPFYDTGAMVGLVLVRKFAPQLAHDPKRLRPAAMPVSANHVIHDKIPAGLERVANLSEKNPKVNEMVQALNRHPTR